MNLNGKWNYKHSLNELCCKTYLGIGIRNYNLNVSDIKLIPMAEGGSGLGSPSSLRQRSK
jgi:hypothetical protein